jgi:hypothetical protein
MRVIGDRELSNCLRKLRHTNFLAALMHADRLDDDDLRKLGHCAAVRHRKVLASMIKSPRPLIGAGILLLSD